MAELVPAGAGSVAMAGGSGEQGDMLGRLTAQPAVRRAMPWVAGLAFAGVAALAWATLSAPPQRVLYERLGDAEKQAVAESLTGAGIAYELDSATGAITVGADDIYRARMVAAADGAVAVPGSAPDLIDSLPMGASRSVEAERLRQARERELVLSIMAISGVESARVHLAEEEKSVFVRESSPPRASVVVKLARGRQLADEQVQAIINLVAGSVPGLATDAVRVIDQAGRLLSDPRQGKDSASERFDLQTRLEEKMRAQLSHLLAPMVGEGAFSSEVQIELDMDATSTARETYDKDGQVIRRESTETSSQPGEQAAGGIPGALANTPPPPPVVENAAPEGTPPPAAGAAGAEGSASATRTFEIGREIAVSDSMPGTIKRLSVAVVLSKEALGKASAADVQQLERLVGSTVGANPQRGDQVTVIVRPFKQAEAQEPLPFYQEAWFEMVVRNAVALIAVLLVLIFGMRPVMKALKPRRTVEEAPVPIGEAAALVAAAVPSGTPPPMTMDEAAQADAIQGQLSRLPLAEQVGLAQQVMRNKPESAVTAIRHLLREPDAVDGGKQDMAA